MREKPRIAILSIRNTYKFGGVLATLKTAYRFCHRYFDPTVLVLSFDKTISMRMRSLKFSSTSRHTTFSGMPCIEIGARWGLWEPCHYAATIDQWRAALKDFDYFFVVSATPIAGHPLALLDKKFLIWASTTFQTDRAAQAKKMSGMRRLINTMATPVMNKIEATILKKSSFILALSSYSKALFTKILDGKNSNITLCPYPMETTKKHIQFRDDDMIIAVGRFSDPRKNLTMLLDVFDKIHKKKDSRRLYIIGEKPTKEQLKDFSRRPSFSHVVFTGPLDTCALNRYLGQARLKLITSHEEGFGIAGLQALAHGVPVVATQCGGVQDFVINEKTGFLVSVNDSNTMAQKAQQILRDQNLYGNLVDYTHTFVKEHFSEQYVFSRFKHGFVATYPELQRWFETCDGMKT